jgi:hypothetical protein
MMEKLISYFYALMDHMLLRPEGIILYICGAITITAVHLYNMKDWRIGLRGENGHWESPEVCVYIFTWIFPHTIMADQFLALQASDWVWWFEMSLLLFGLTGRFGLNWLLAFKSGSNKVDGENGSQQDIK